MNSNPRQKYKFKYKKKIIVKKLFIILKNSNSMANIGQSSINNMYIP